MWGVYLWKEAKRGQQKTYDIIPLTLNNISKNIYNNEIVVLNCCYTASGESYYNSGQNTIALNFFSKGAQNVIGTLWPVPDKYSKEFFVWFYTYFQRTQSFLDAFNLTQRMYVEQKKAPYFWGNFRFYGWN
jgi:CHAT domain-containing protein